MIAATDHAMKELYWFSVYNIVSYNIRFCIHLLSTDYSVYRNCTLNAEAHRLNYNELAFKGYNTTIVYACMFFTFPISSIIFGVLINMFNLEKYL